MGSYVGERQWATVRRIIPLMVMLGPFNFDDLEVAYRWGEDGLAGVSDRNNLSTLPWLYGMGKILFLRKIVL